MKIFISHSSSDKENYVDIVVERLKKLIGVDKIVYDAITFEKGAEINAEIKTWIDKSDIFVVFLSEAALESKWVRNEIFLAKAKCDESSLRKIFPISIQYGVRHDHEKIPKWMREMYNIRVINKPKIAAQKIYNRVIALVWEQNPILQAKGKLFVGRNDLIKEIENRYDSIEKPQITTLLASGLNEIGRRTLLKHSLAKIDVINNSYEMPCIILDGHQSIEDLMMYLYDYGFGAEVEYLSTSTLEQKVKSATDMLVELKGSNEILQIIDTGAIVSPDGNISEWFIKINQELLKKYSGIVFCVVSRHKPNFNALYSVQNIFSIHVGELNDSEREGLFVRYSRIIGLSLDKEDVMFVSNFFSGMPNEILFTADYIKSEGLRKIKNDPSIITDYADDRVSNILSQYDKSSYEYNLLVLISIFDVISYSMLISFTNAIKSNIDLEQIINAFFTAGICENIGNNGEYIVLNSAIKNYIQRKKVDLLPEFKEVINECLKRYNNTIDEYEFLDISEVFFLLRQAIENEVDVKDNRYIIPSHYLKSMKELYDSRDKDELVVELADRILSNEYALDKKIAHEIRYFKCSALARLKSEKFKDEVHKITGPDHDFLFGFYYRHVGRDDEAIKRLLSALEKRPKFGRAKRELVLVYSNNEEYDKAYNLAKENYEMNKNNEYHIQAYYQCVLFSKNNELMSYELKNKLATQLLNDMKMIDSRRASSMLAVMKMQYDIFVSKEIEKAKKEADEYMDKDLSDVYILMTCFDVYEKNNDKIKMKEAIDILRKKCGKKNSKFYKEFLKREISYKKMIGGELEARNYLTKLGIDDKLKNVLLSRI